MHVCVICVWSSIHDNKTISTSPTALFHHPNVKMFVFKTESHHVTICGWPGTHRNQNGL